jgi:hypothetical protein
LVILFYYKKINYLTFYFAVSPPSPNAYIFSVAIGRYIKTAAEQRLAFGRAKDIWDEESKLLLVA